MYTARFFSTPLGRAALVSILALAALNCIALTRQINNGQIDLVPHVYASAAAITGEPA
ncbi:hypothetical protein [Novosphingobium sp. FKTRR1]|uniref:hypothetical protein n=1 Tax=unclassified Novosphingobium TaxID=2644732 RepID=UPI001CF06632|nr:hypothetical protein [Novosphingobium sp. FKTRR1]